MKKKNKTLPLGKLRSDILASFIGRAPINDPSVILGPGVGMDCAVVDMGSKYLVYKSDPITFATDEIGWYAVQVNVNDIATTGAIPRWFLLTLLLPEGETTEDLVEKITDQVYSACAEMSIAVIGGHTEITHGLNRPIIAGTLIGEVDRDRLITPRGSHPGDRILLTKGVPIEATAIIAREFPDRVGEFLNETELKQAVAFLTTPGISVLRDAQIALEAGKVTAMHDPTEGGLFSALWELSEACGHSLSIDNSAVPIPHLALRICKAFKMNPFAAIASGALLVATKPDDTDSICGALEDEGIDCAEIGVVEDGPVGVWCESSTDRKEVIRPEQDEIARIFES
mgnify:CR=1 FL=1